MVLQTTELGIRAVRGDHKPPAEVATRDCAGNQFASVSNSGCCRAFGVPCMARVVCAGFRNDSLGVGTRGHSCKSSVVHQYSNSDRASSHQYYTIRPPFAGCGLVHIFFSYVANVVYGMVADRSKRIFRQATRRMSEVRI